MSRVVKCAHIQASNAKHDGTPAEIKEAMIQKHIPLIEKAGKKGVNIVVPSTEMQGEAMAAIYDHVKAGDLQGGREVILRVADELVNNDIQAILCGCTEVSLVLKDGDLTTPVLDPLQVLAEHAVKYALVL